MMMKLKRGFWLASSQLGEKCDDFRMLELYSEYSIFIMDLDAEKNLIKHIQQCHNCLTHLKQLIHDENPSNEWWRKLLTNELNHTGNILEENQLSIKQTNCNSLEKYSFTNELIKKRIHLRIERIKELKKEAKLELESLKNHIRFDI